MERKREKSQYFLIPLKKRKITQRTNTDDKLKKNTTTNFNKKKIENSNSNLSILCKK